MNPTDNSSTGINETIQKGTAGVILLPVNPTQDAISAATTLYLGLTKLGKNVSIACETTAKSDITGSDKIQSEFTTSGDNLVVSFPYTDGAIDKVDYNIQGDTFNLIITPRSTENRLDPDQVKFSYAGGAVDFIITVDAPNLNSLGKIFMDNRDQFQGKAIVNIDRHLVNDFYGTVNLVNKTVSSTCELALRFLQEAECEIDKDMASNLYNGLVGATNNFSSYSVNAETFEAAALLLKMGAIKKQIKKPEPTYQQAQPVRPQPQMNQNNNVNNNSNQKQRPPQPPRDTQRDVQRDAQRENRNSQQPQKIVTPPQMNTMEQQMKPIDIVEQEPEVKKQSENSQEWLKPKIFRGTGLI